MVNFPVPVGGTVYPIDLAPAILFAVLYGMLVPLMFYRMFQRRGRSTLLIGTIAFSIERRAFQLLSYLVKLTVHNIQNRHFRFTSCSGTFSAATVLPRTSQLYASVLWFGVYRHFERPCRSFEVFVDQSHLRIKQVRRVSSSGHEGWLYGASTLRHARHAKD